MSVPGSADVQVDSWAGESEDRSLANDVLDGLTKPFKELRAGASDKARILLDAMRAAGTLRRYVPSTCPRADDVKPVR